MTTEDLFNEVLALGRKAAASDVRAHVAAAVTLLHLAACLVEPEEPWLENLSAFSVGNGQNRNAFHSPGDCEPRN